jgi:hypothetical protein
VYTPLESSPNRCVQLPWDVGRAEDKDTLRVLAHAIHLDQELGLDSSRGFRFTFTARPTQSIDLVDKDDGRLVLSSHAEQLLDETK